jgi:hypothetical protein
MLLLYALDTRRKEHRGHPRPHLGVCTETLVGVMHVPEVVGQIVSAGYRLFLLADPYVLRGLPRVRMLHRHNFAHQPSLSHRHAHGSVHPFKVLGARGAEDLLRWQDCTSASD